MNIVFTDTAIEDIETIYQYYLTISSKLAIDLYNQILGEIEILENFPDIAPVEPILNEEAELMRSLIILKGRYKVIYFVNDESITVTDLWDCRQDPGKLRLKKRTSG